MTTLKILILIDIRKHFYQTPMSENVPEGATVHMHCSPPEGEPKVEV